MTGAEPLRAALGAALAADPRVHLLGEALEHAPATRGLAARHPGRSTTLPMSERLQVEVALGMATGGAIPVLELATGAALWGALRGLADAAARGPELPARLVLRAPAEGAPLAALLGVPGLAIAAASTQAEQSALLDAALAHVRGPQPGPVVLLEDADLPAGEAHPALPLGQARRLREGGAVSLLSFGAAAAPCLEAAAALSAEGIEAEVIDLRSLRPLDARALSAALMATGRPVLVGAPRELLLDAALLAFLRLESPPGLAEPTVAAITAAARASATF